MTKVAILPIITEQGDKSYHAIAGRKQSAGATADAALDAVTAHLLQSFVVIHTPMLKKPALDDETIIIN